MLRLPGNKLPTRGVRRDPRQPNITPFLPGAPPTVTVSNPDHDARWLAWLSDPLNSSWSTLCTLEDWVRIHLLSTRVNCEWRNLFLHSPIGICTILADAPPPPELLQLAYDSLSSLEDLTVALENSLSEALLPTIPTLSRDSWRFVARWLRSFPPANPRIRLSYSATKGLSVL